jgi:two-component system, cell cycle response regulator DivK
VGLCAILRHRKSNQGKSANYRRKSQRGRDVPKRILIVEDNTMNLKLFCDVLTAYGYDLAVAEDGTEALRLVLEQPPDLILLDLQLPDITGFEVVRRIREMDALKTVPVIAVTAFAMAGDEEKALAAGCDGYITKPISIPDFKEQIRKALKEPG